MRRELSERPAVEVESAVRAQVCILHSSSSTDFCCDHGQWRIVRIHLSQVPLRRQMTCGPPDASVSLHFSARSSAAGQFSLLLGTGAQNIISIARNSNSFRLWTQSATD